MQNDLVIDVGFHRGADACFYLDQGFRCVAVGANPDLVAEAGTAFAEEPADGGLRIFALAIAEESGTVPLAVASEGRDWSSLLPGFVGRNGNLSGTHHRTVNVPAIRFEDALAEVGIPRCLKVDIEGLDMLCFRALRMFDERPDFVSLESAVLSLDAPLEKAFEQLAKLWSLCYRRFAYVDQSANPFPSDAEPASGRSLRRYAADLEAQWIFRRRDARALGVNRTHMLRAEALRIHHNPAGYRGAWTHNPLTRPYVCLTNIASRLRRPFRRGKGHLWSTCTHAWNRSHRSAAPRVPI
jgi:FkbM family methyltransferase